MAPSIPNMLCLVHLIHLVSQLAIVFVGMKGPDIGIGPWATLEDVK